MYLRAAGAIPLPPRERTAESHHRRRIAARKEMEITRRRRYEKIAVLSPAHRQESRSPRGPHTLTTPASPTSF